MLSTSRQILHRSISRQTIRSQSTATSASQGSHSCVLPNGRTLGYYEYGRPSGSPVFFFHGMPDSGIAIRTTNDIADKVGVRFIGIDRPGYGLSTFYSNRKVTDWPSDFQNLVDHLKIDRYRIVSVSGGTGYALACAKALPKERLRGVGIIAGIGPWEAGTRGQSLMNRIGMNLWAYTSVMETVQARYLARLAQDSDPQKLRLMWEKSLKYFNSRDREVLEKPEEVELACDVFRQVYKQGAEAHIEEARLMVSHWGFNLEDVKYDKIKLWYGDKDVNTPVRMGEYMKQRLPHADLHVYPGESHFTIWNHIEEMLTHLLEE